MCILTPVVFFVVCLFICFRENYTQKFKNWRYFQNIFSSFFDLTASQEINEHQNHSYLTRVLFLIFSFLWDLVIWVGRGNSLMSNQMTFQCNYLSVCIYFINWYVCFYFWYLVLRFLFFILHYSLFLHLLLFCFLSSFYGFGFHILFF